MKYFILAILLFVFGITSAMAGELEPEKWQFYIAVIMSVLLSISEALSMIPAIKANGVFQFLVNLLKALTSAK